MATIKAEYYRFNGTSWDLFYFKTSADLLVETASYKVMTAAERDAITDYLTTFNAANKLLKLDENDKIHTKHIPVLPYLSTSGGTLNGKLTISGVDGLDTYKVVAPRVYTDKIISDSDVITVGALELTFDESGQINNLDIPTLGHQAATKEYVDNLISVGFKVKDPVKAASVGNVTIASALNTLDGYTLEVGDRVLLKSQTTTSENGVYQLNASKIPVKVENDSTLGSAVFVENGEVNNDYIFTQSEPDSWKVFTKPDTIKAGSGLAKDGTTISIASGGVTNAMLAGLIEHGKIKSFAADDADLWATIISADVNKSLVDHLTDLYSAIRLSRGTANYNTGSTQSIAGAYTHADNIAASRNKTRTGTDLPSTLNVTGDLFFKTIT